MRQGVRQPNVSPRMDGTQHLSTRTSAWQGNCNGDARYVASTTGRPKDGNQGSDQLGSWPKKDEGRVGYSNAYMVQCQVQEVRNLTIEEPRYTLRVWTTATSTRFRNRYLDRGPRIQTGLRLRYSNLTIEDARIGIGQSKIQEGQG